MIITQYDALLMKGYRKAILDLINYIDRHSIELKYDRLMNVVAVKSLLMCIWEEYEDLYFYGDFERRFPCLSPSKDKNGKNQDRKFFFMDDNNEVLRMGL